MFDDFGYIPPKQDIQVISEIKSTTNLPPLISIILNKGKGQSMLDIPDDLVVIPNENEQYRKSFKIYSQPMTIDEFLLKFMKHYRKGKKGFAQEKLRSVDSCFIHYTSRKFYKWNASNLSYLGVKRLDNGFCYAQLLTSTGALMIIFYDTVAKNFSFFIPTRGNNYNYYTEFPVMFKPIDMFWINKQLEPKGIKVQNAAEAKSYFFTSMELMSQEIEHYASVEKPVKTSYLKSGAPFLPQSLSLFPLHYKFGEEKQYFEYYDD